MKFCGRAKIVAMLGGIVAGGAAIGLAPLTTNAELPSGPVCRVDEEFGVRCRDLESKLSPPASNGQALASFSSYDRFVEIGRDRYNGGDMQGAISFYTQAIALNGNNPQAFGLRGTAHLSSHQPHEAILDYTRALELGAGGSIADAANYVGRGMSHSQLGQLQEAVVDATQAIAIHPSFAAAYLLRGNAKNHLHDSRGACADWQQAANLYWEREQFSRYTEVLESFRTSNC